MWRDLAGAFAFLTVLPLYVDSRGRQPGWIFAYFPLVGAALGGILYAIAALSIPNQDLHAFLLLLAWVVLTGGLHLDGFGDACDGLFAAVPVERRLEIMKDSRAGSWAVIGLGLLLLGKWVVLRTAAPAALLLAPVLGRWVMVVAAWGFPYARATGIGGHFRQGLGRAQVALATLFLALVMVMVQPSPWVALAPLAGLLGAVWAARRLNGGLTGDIYGGVCELTEWASLVVLVWQNA